MIGKMIRTSIVSTVGMLLLSGVVSSALAFGPGGGGIGGIGSRGMSLITGKVLCANCNLEQMRQAHPESRQLYQLNHAEGQIVVQVSSVNGQESWRAPQSDELRVRSLAQVFRALTSKDNMMKDIEITSLLSKDGRNLDIFDVAVSG